VTRAIVRPLHALHRGTEIIGEGNLSYRVGTKARDEIGQLSRAFDQMTEGLAGTTSSLEELNKEIAQRKRIEHELHEMNEQLDTQNVKLQDLDRLKSIFLASMSHELRTPLNAIIGFTSLILQGMVGEINEEQKKQLALVESSAYHLLSLINDVLDIAKIEADKVELSLEEFALDDLMREAVGILTPIAELKKIELLGDAPEGVTMFSDKRRLKQVLINLIGNAVKFTEKGSVKVKAKVLGKDKLAVSVIDTGIGLKQEDIDKLFTPFQQAGDSLIKKQQGTGLGLYLCRKLVNLLGGEISVKSEFGKGSEFAFTLPLKYKEVKKIEESIGD
jgi:signal transduction histidine kinase